MPYGSAGWQRRAIGLRSIGCAPALEARVRLRVEPDAISRWPRVGRCSNLSALDKVTTSVLVTNYGLEQFYPGQAVRRCKLLGSPKRLVAFTIAEGPEYHDGPTAL
jgi:hypothetical protein